MIVRITYDLSTLSERALVHLVAALLVESRRGIIPEYATIAASLMQEAGRRAADGPNPGPQELELHVEHWNPRLRQNAATLAAAFRGALDTARASKVPIDLEALADCALFTERLVGAIDLCTVEGGQYVS